MGMAAGPAGERAGPTVRVTRRGGGGVTRCSSFTGSKSILRTSRLEVVAAAGAAGVAEKEDGAGDRGLGGGLAFMAAAERVGMLLEARTGRVGAGTEGRGKMMMNGEKVAMPNGRGGTVPMAPDLRGMYGLGNQGVEAAVGRHSKYCRARLSDLSPVVQATHPEVRGVAVYMKSDGERVEVDVAEYVEKLNEEIVALREQVQGLMAQGGGGRMKRMTTFLKKKDKDGEKGTKKGAGAKTSPTTTACVGEKTSKPVLTPKPAVSFPKGFGGAATGTSPSTTTAAAAAASGAGSKQVITPKPTVSFPTGFGGPTSSSATESGGGNSFGVKASSGTAVVAKSKGSGAKVSFAKPLEVGWTATPARWSGLSSGGQKEEKKDPIAAALGAVEPFELKKKKPTTSANAAATTDGNKGKTEGRKRARKVNKRAATRPQGVQRKVQVSSREIENQVTAPPEDATQKPKEVVPTPTRKEGADTIQEGVDAPMAPIQVLEKKQGPEEQRKEGNALGKRFGVTGRRRVGAGLKKSLSFVNKKGKGQGMIRSVSAGKLDQVEETVDLGATGEGRRAMERKRDGRMGNQELYRENAKPTMTVSAAVTAQTAGKQPTPQPEAHAQPKTQPPSQTKNSKGTAGKRGRRIFSSLMRGRRG